MKYQTQVVVGAQWGDEGKGKITDYLAQNADVVIRFQGGNNAGHTVMFNQKKYALRHIPSGIFNPKTINVLGQGMVINPKELINEINYLKQTGCNNFQLLISNRAHVIFHYHIDLDIALEKFKQDNWTEKMIGTTKNGIGPAYEDKISRIGIRFGDFINPPVFKKLLTETLMLKNHFLQTFNQKQYVLETLYNEYLKYAQQLKPYVKDTSLLIEDAIINQKHVLFEGAQGTMLCLDNGTYPYVTSSSPTAAAIALGAGINFHYLNDVMGVVKAYTTRVGEGFLPTMIQNQEIAEKISIRGHEYGTVTGRKRRIGWLDIVVLKHAIRIGGITSLTITLLDVLDEFSQIKLCYAYELDNQEIDYVPSSNEIYKRVLPKYITLEGWMTDTTKVKKYQDLPQNAQKYLSKISQLVNLPIKMFSVAPDRNQTIII